jgi:imidazolonepropionase-like amidohydrolase
MMASSLPVSPSQTATSHSLQNILTPKSDGTSVWLRVGRVIDGNGSPPLFDAHLLYDVNAIRHVGPACNPIAHELAAGRSQPDAWLPDHTVLPSLIEAHAHIFLDGAPLDFAERKAYLQQTPDFFLARARGRLAKLLRTGISAVRDAGDKFGVGLAIANDYRKRSQHEPHVYLDSPGAAIHHAGRYGGFMSDPLEQHASPEACVNARVAGGADRIKIIATGIINFDAGAVTAPPQIPVEELKRLVAEAAVHRRTTFAHASGTDGIENCIQAEIGSIEHGFFVTDDQLARMRDLDIAWVPTFAPVQIQIDAAKELGWPPSIVEKLQKIIDAHVRALQHAIKLGVTIIAGSDAGSCGVPHGLGLLTELELMQIAGMAPASVLNAATGISARALQFPEPIGRIAKNYRPRMIVTSHNPLQSVANLRKDKHIVHDHHVLHCLPQTSEGL